MSELHFLAFFPFDQWNLGVLKPFSTYSFTKKVSQLKRQEVSEGIVLLNCAFLNLTFVLMYSIDFITCLESFEFGK